MKLTIIHLPNSFVSIYGDCGSNVSPFNKNVSLVNKKRYILRILRGFPISVRLFFMSKHVNLILGYKEKKWKEGSSVVRLTIAIVMSLLAITESNYCI